MYVQVMARASNIYICRILFQSLLALQTMSKYECMQIACNSKSSLIILLCSLASTCNLQVGAYIEAAFSLACNMPGQMPHVSALASLGPADDVIDAVEGCAWL